MREPSTIRHRLATVRRQLRRRQLLAAAIRSLGLLGALLLLADAVNRLVPLRESTSLVLLLASATVAALVLGYGLLRQLLFQPRLEQIAHQVEAARPETMDAFIAATELERRPEAEWRVLERALVDKMRQDTRDWDLRHLVFPEGLHRPGLALQAVLFGLLAVAALHTPLLDKALFRTAELTGRGPAGLAVMPGNAECAKHSDLGVTATVRRWQNQARIEVRDAAGTLCFPMTPRHNQWQFTFYDLIEPASYRVVTPLLQSPWYRIAVFEPPRADAVNWRIRQPAYTGLPERRLESWEPVAALQGSELMLEAKLPEGISAILNIGPRQIDLAPTASERHTASLTLAETTSAELLLKDGAGHETRLPPVVLTAMPDLPPVIDVLVPGRDTVVKPADTLPVEARAADDFGLARITLEYSVSGGTRRQVVLFDGQGQATGDRPPAELPVRLSLDPTAIGAQAGDMVSYVFTATDSRQPDSQRTRSQVFFVEVRPDIEPEKVSGGMEQKKKELDIGALIAESKRLIRLSYDLAARPDGDAALLHQLKTGAADFHTALVREVQEIQAMLSDPAGGLPPMARLINESAELADQARKLLARGLAEDALPLQERGLARLIAVAQELMKQPISDSGKGEGGTSGDQAPKPGQEQKPPKSAKEQLEQLSDLAQRLAALADRQAGANERYERHQDSRLGEAEQAELTSSQLALAEQTRALAGELAASGMQRPRQSLLQAGTAMNAAAGLVGQGRLETALREGLLAQTELLAAADNLRESMRELSANQIRNLARQAESLAGAQRALAGESAKQHEAGTQDREEAARLRTAQETLNEATRQMLDDAERKLADLEQDYPQAAGAMASALQQARNDRLASKMTRAGNALRYARFDRARDYQADTANDLQQLASRLGAAAAKLPRLSQQELMNAIRRLQQALQQLEQVRRQQDDQPDQTLKQIRSNASEQLRELSRQLGDQGLDDLATALEMLPSDGSSPGAVDQAHRLLQTATRLLHRHLLAGELEKKMRLNRATTVLPERYRNQIEQYFRSLSEGD